MNTLLNVVNLNEEEEKSYVELIKRSRKDILWNQPRPVQEVYKGLCEKGFAYYVAIPGGRQFMPVTQEMLDFTDSINKIKNKPKKNSTIVRKTEALWKQLGITLAQALKCCEFAN